MILHTVTVRPLGNYRLYLTFNNGVSGEVDLTDELWGEIFEPLKDPLLFQTAHQDEVMQTVSWNNGADLAPEFLMEILIKQHQQAGCAGVGIGLSR
jgi:hypothetical protein